MNVLLILANPQLYAAKGDLNAGLFETSQKWFSQKHTIFTSEIADGNWDIDQEVAKLKQSNLIIYHFPIWWFGVPSVLKRYFDEVLIHKETFLITDVYGEGGQLQNKTFMMAVTSNMKKSDLGSAPILKSYHHIDDILTQIILTNQYLGIQNQLDTFHADDVVNGKTNHVITAYERLLNTLSI